MIWKVQITNFPLHVRMYCWDTISYKHHDCNSNSSPLMKLFPSQGFTKRQYFDTNLPLLENLPEQIEFSSNSAIYTFIILYIVRSRIRFQGLTTKRQYFDTNNRLLENLPEQIEYSSNYLFLTFSSSKSWEAVSTFKFWQQRDNILIPISLYCRTIQNI